jgi:hypothetical protein
MTEIDRLARALCRHYCAGQAEFCTAEECTDWDSYTDEVRVVLAALREPSEGMQKAGVAALCKNDNCAPAIPFRAMIDHLLQEKEQGE